MAMTVLFEEDFPVGRKLSCKNALVETVAYYDVFAETERLKEFVESIASGDTNSLQVRAQQILRKNEQLYIHAGPIDNKPELSVVE